MKFASLFAAVVLIWSGAALAEVRAITPISELERSTMVTVQGVVDRITDEDEFILRDDTGTVEVYVGPNWVPVDLGEAITVQGFIDSSLFIEVYAREITRSSGDIIRMGRAYE